MQSRDDLFAGALLAFNEGKEYGCVGDDIPRDLIAAGPGRDPDAFKRNALLFEVAHSSILS
jgi:hypothetical protein